MKFQDINRSEGTTLFQYFNSRAAKLGLTECEEIRNLAALTSPSEATKYLGDSPADTDFLGEESWEITEKSFPAELFQVYEGHGQIFVLTDISNIPEMSIKEVKKLTGTLAAIRAAVGAGKPIISLCYVGHVAGQLAIILSDREPVSRESAKQAAIVGETGKLVTLSNESFTDAMVMTMFIYTNRLLQYLLKRQGETVVMKYVNNILEFIKTYSSVEA